MTKGGIMSRVSVWKKYEALEMNLSVPSTSLAWIRTKRQHLQAKLILQIPRSGMTKGNAEIIAHLNRLADEEDRFLNRQ
jgi:hypothetical protein